MRNYIEMIESEDQQDNGKEHVLTLMQRAIDAAKDDKAYATLEAVTEAMRALRALNI